MTIELLNILFFSLTHHDSSESLHTFDDCLKYSESTVRIGTHVKPLIFTLDVFAVYVKKNCQIMRC